MASDDVAYTADSRSGVVRECSAEGRVRCCVTCGAVVAKGAVAYHNQWHKRLEQRAAAEEVEVLALRTALLAILGAGLERKIKTIAREALWREKARPAGDLTEWRFD